MGAASFSRRDFLRTTASGAAAGMLAAQSVAGAAPSQRPTRIGLVGLGQRGQTHLDLLLRIQALGAPVEVVYLCDVYDKSREKAQAKLAARGRSDAKTTVDFLEVLEAPDVDAVVVATPNHWHAAQSILALERGKHVYCETPMIHHLEELRPLLEAWKASGKVMQVGAQRLSDGRWTAAREFLLSGGVGKVLHAQTEAFRNSSTGQWRNLGLSRDMTPEAIDWPRFLGVEYGLSAAVPFDRALFSQWRCSWAFGSGLFGELFMPKLCPLLTAMGVSYPRRVVCTGGVFLELDGREVPDTATLVADFPEGCQAVASATLGNDHPIEQLIRGHHGTLRFEGARDGFEVLPQKPQVTREREQAPRRISAPKPADELLAHWENFLVAVAQGAPAACAASPETIAPAVVTSLLGRESYRRGAALEWDAARLEVRESGPGYAQSWEAASHRRELPQQPAGWQPSADFRSRQKPGDHQRLAGPWPAGNPPAADA